MIHTRQQANAIVIVNGLIDRTVDAYYGLRYCIMQYITKNPGKKNCDITRELHLGDISRKQFVSHYTVNHDLYAAHDIKRVAATYHPTKHIKNRTLRGAVVSNEAIIQTCQRHKRVLLSGIKDIIMQKYNMRDAVCNTDISKMLHLHGTTLGNHQDWFTWEVIDSHLEEWGIQKVKYEDMSHEQQCHVTHVDMRKQYLLPVRQTPKIRVTFKSQ